MHRPRSRLYPGLVELMFSEFMPPTCPAPSEEEWQQRHTAKALKSASETIDLFILSLSPRNHSPFVMCMGTLATATQISACENILKGKEYQEAKDRVRVFIGVLKAFEPIWPQAEKWLRGLKGFARDVFNGRERDDSNIANSFFSVTHGDGSETLREPQQNGTDGMGSFNGLSDI